MAIIARPTDKVMNVNIAYDDMTRAVAGPEDPFNQKKNKGMNTLSGEQGCCLRFSKDTYEPFTGHVEEQAMDDYTFAMQQRTFDVHGYALNPSNLSSISGNAAPLVGSLNAAHENGYLSVQDVRPSKEIRKEMKRKRDGKGDAGVVDGEGAYLGPWAGWEGDKDVEIVVEEEAEEWRDEKRKREEAKTAAAEKMKLAREEKSIFHGKSYGLAETGQTCLLRSGSQADGTIGKELTDYAGRTYMHIPTDKDVKLNPTDGTAPPNAYLPERCIHTWVSETPFASMANSWLSDWTQQGCFCDQIIPKIRASIVKCKFRYESQGRLRSWDQTTTNDSAAVGCV
jgi:pre-mRNA-processing factor 17